MKNLVVKVLLLVAACGPPCHTQIAYAQDLMPESMPTAQAVATVQPMPTAQAMPAVQAEEIHGGGSWADAADAMVASVGQRWNIDALHFSDDRISGRVGISGSDIIESANVDAQFSGRGVRGKLLDDDGKELAEFEGRVTAAGAAGTYRALTGEVGQWQWAGQVQPLQSAQPEP